MRLPQRLENFMGSLGEQVLLGTVIGDGCLIKRPKSTEIQLAHCEKQKQYLLWKVKLLQQSGIQFYNYECNYGKDENGKVKYCSKNSNVIPLYKQIFYHSNAYLELNDYYKMFYRGRQKIIRRKILNLFQPLALAIWIQDDGNLTKSNMIRLATHCFSEKENKMIARYFKTVWHLTAKISQSQGKYFSIRFGVESTKRLIEIIKPYIDPSMQYKIDLVSKMSLEERNKRFMMSGTPYQFQKGQEQTNTGRTRFQKEHPYYPRKNSLNGNQTAKFDDIV